MKLQWVMTDEAIRNLQARNAARVAALPKVRRVCRDVPVVQASSTQPDVLREDRFWNRIQGLAVLKEQQ